MKKNTFGRRTAQLRKARGMTQQTLAEQMGVTDKAVSKWERDLSFPDAATLPRLAEILGVTVDELMQPGAQPGGGASSEMQNVISIILKAVPLAMGVAVTVLAALGEIDLMSAVTMLGIGLACLAIRSFREP